MLNKIINEINVKKASKRRSSRIFKLVFADKKINLEVTKEITTPTEENRPDGIGPKVILANDQKELDKKFDKYNIHKKDTIDEHIDEIKVKKEDKGEKKASLRKATGEADGDYDEKFFDGLLDEVEKAGFDAKYKEFDKYQGVYFNVLGVDTFWVKEVFITGKTKKEDVAKPYIKTMLIDQDGEEYSANKGDYFNLPKNHVFEGYLLFLQKQDGTEERIENPKIEQLPDTTDVMSTFQYEENTSKDNYVFYPESNPDESITVINDNGKVDASEMIEYCKTNFKKEAGKNVNNIKEAIWKDTLHNVYNNEQEWKVYANKHGLHIKLGYSTPHLAWVDNCMVQGSTDPSSYKKAEFGDKVKYTGDIEHDFEYAATVPDVVLESTVFERITSPDQIDELVKYLRERLIRIYRDNVAFGNDLVKLENGKFGARDKLKMWINHWIDGYMHGNKEASVDKKAGFDDIKDEATKQKMEKLAEETGLTWDGETDSRLWLDDQISINTMAMTRQEYEAWEKEADSKTILKDGYEVYVGYDISGYSYWHDTMGESNYIFVTVDIDVANIDSINPDELRDDANEMYAYFADKYGDLTNREASVKVASNPSSKAPSEWWNEKIKEIKKDNPSYSNEIARETLGKIWSNLDENKKKEIRKRYHKTYSKPQK